MRALFEHLWSVPGARVLLIVIAVETVFITATIIWLYFQNRRDERTRARESDFESTLAETFFDALNEESDDALDAWYQRAKDHPASILRDFLHRTILRAGDEDRERLIRHYRKWNLLEHDRRMLASDRRQKRILGLRRMHTVATSEDRDVLMERIGDDHLEKVITAQIIARVGNADDIIDLLDDVKLESGLMEEPLYATIERMERDMLREVFERRDEFDEPRIRRILLEVAADRGLNAAREAVVAAVSSEDVEERIGACNAAAFFDADTGPDVLLDLIEDERWEVRSRAAKVIRRFPRERVFDALRRAMTDQAFWVRQNAANSLLWMGDEGRSVLEDIRSSSQDKFAVDSATQELQRYEYFSTAAQRHLSIGPRGAA